MVSTSHNVRPLLLGRCLRWLLAAAIGCTLTAVCLCGCADADRAGTAARRTPPVRLPSDEDVARQLQAEWVRIERWAHREAPGYNLALSPPVAANQIDAVQSRLGTTFSRDFRASLEMHNGQRDPAYGFFFAFPLLNLAAIERDNPPDSATADTPAGKDKGRLIRVAGNDEAWFVLDMSGANGGAAGQILLTDGDGGNARPLAPSFVLLLRAWADLLESNDCQVVEADGKKLIRPKEGVKPLDAIDHYARRYR